MKSERIFTVDRVSNAWIVTFGESGSFFGKTETFESWPKLVKALKDFAFFTPTEPRGPR